MSRSLTALHPAPAAVTLSLVLILFATHALAASHANVFVYHRFGDDRYPSTNISIETFRQHLEILRDTNRTVVTMGELVALLQRGTELPEGCAVITIDDGYRSFLTGAMPLLREFGMRATLFVSTDSVGDTDYLDWHELRRLQEEGIEIGNHSATHDYLLDRLPGENDVAWQARVKADLLRAQAAFMANLQVKPTLFAYPYGEFSPKFVEIVQGAGFEAACGQQSGVVVSGGDLFTLPRFPMGGDFTDPVAFEQKLRMHPLRVDVLEPDSPVLVDENPPRLRFRLVSDEVKVDTLRCFVPGQDNANLFKVAGKNEVYEVTAAKALKGRRSKYTLTASDRTGQTWYWFSYLWVLPRL